MKATIRLGVARARRRRPRSGVLGAPAFARRHLSRGLRSDGQLQGQPGRRLRPFREGTLDAGRRLQHRRPRRRARRLGRRSPRLTGLARLRQADGLLYAVNAGSNTVSVFARLRRQAGAAPGDRLGRDLPRQHRRARRPRVRAQRARTADRCRASRSPPDASSRSPVQSRARPRARPKRRSSRTTPGTVVFSPERLAADRHDQGQRQRRRRLRRLPRRRAVGDAGRRTRCRARCRSRSRSTAGARGAARRPPAALASFQLKRKRRARAARRGRRQNRSPRAGSRKRAGTSTRRTPAAAR